MHFLIGDIGGYRDGIHQLNDDNGAITQYDMKGNWHFVMIHACRSGQTSAFADALHITGYSNRGFIGWFDTISNYALVEWSPKFYSLVGNTTLTNAHKTAAEQCEYSTPARFFGDRNWYGWAW